MIKTLSGHARRVAIETVNLFLNRSITFRLIGLLNRRTGFLASVFLFYPANDHYGLNYAYRWRLERNRWRPWPSGLIVQNGRLTLIFGVSSTEVHFRDPQHRENLARLEHSMERLRRTLGAEQKTFAGILPGLFHKHGIINHPPEADTTADIVAASIERLVEENAGHPFDDVVLLGGAGFIGTRLAERLHDRFKVHIADTAVPDSIAEAEPVFRAGCVVVNLASARALDGISDWLGSGSIVLNEVYPEPDEAVIRQLSKRGVRCFHVAGVEAKAFPPFPRAYAGAIPCCAAWSSAEAVPKVRELGSASITAIK